METKISKITENVKNIAIISMVILLIIIVLSWNRSCEQNASYANYVGSLNEEITLKENKIGTMTAEISTIQLEKKHLQELVINKNDSLKKLAKEFNDIKSIVHVKSEVKIKEVRVPFEVQIPCDEEFIITGDSEGHFDSKYFRFNFEINNNEMALFDISVPTEQFVMNGIKRKWFLGKPYITTTVTHTNKYIVINGVKSYEQAVNTEWYNSRLFNIGVGLILGGVTVSQF